jgi:hypothetical protein
MNTRVPVEHVVAYWSRVLAPAETQYSATECKALATKESLVRFQPFIEGERILLVTDHAMLTWAKTYENTNRRLAAWGLVFAAFLKLVIVRQSGRAHSNVDPLSQLPHIPTFISPARDDLPSLTVSTEHQELQQAWEAFIKEHELAVESKPVLHNQMDRKQASLNPSNLHAYADKEAVRCFVEGYRLDKDITSLVNRTQEELPNKGKNCAYQLGTNGMLYFKDADSNLQLCILKSERLDLIKEIHDSAHESAHAGWECTLANLCE